ncbi:hypothetical protein B0H10DRAFT_2240324 [Mycena sp. CBHHK59/15]|nr:hypothetical protein B0H10DRAFT_2240324 [Mycena sp. CBHHK59/15]
MSYRSVLTWATRNNSMPIAQNKPATNWLDYLNHPLPTCRTRPVQLGSDGRPVDSNDNDLEETHGPGKTLTSACGLPTTIRKSVSVLTCDITSNIARFLKGKGGIIAEEDYIQPLEVFFKDILAPVKAALDTLLGPMLKKGDLQAGGYFFNIRPQQSSYTGDGTRCDHYLVLEHMDGILCMKPNVIREQAFDKNYLKDSEKQGQAGLGARNVVKFLPQVKKYSVDAQCRLVIITDYVTTMLLDVEEAGAYYNLDENKIYQNDEEAKVSVARLREPLVFVCKRSEATCGGGTDQANILHSTEAGATGGLTFNDF